MKEKGNFKYLLSSEKDLLWGMTVDNVGESTIEPMYDVYPPMVGHPNNYYFDPQKGRTLDNYQLVYISKGRGIYHSLDASDVEIEQGDMIIISPNVWHSYYPNPKTGWQEYWIGMQGEDMDKRFNRCFFNHDKTVYKVGFQEEIINLYKMAIDVAIQERPGYQQFLSGIANNILAMVLYLDKNRHFNNNAMVSKMNQAQSIIRDNLFTDLTPAEVAEQLNMSYSQFRQLFKKYTNISPAHYATKLKLQKAQWQLLNSQMNVKEIAWSLNYEDASYFSALFKRYTGSSPSEYREKYDGKNEPTKGLIAKI